MLCPRAKVDASQKIRSAFFFCQISCLTSDLVGLYTKVNLLMWRLFGALKYMHGLGVVHRGLMTFPHITPAFFFA